MWFGLLFHRLHISSSIRQLAGTHFIGFLTSHWGCDPPFTLAIKISALLPAGNIGTLGCLAGGLTTMREGGVGWLGSYRLRYSELSPSTGSSGVGRLWKVFSISANLSVSWWEIPPCCEVELWEQQMKGEEVEWFSLVHTLVDSVSESTGTQTHTHTRPHIVSFLVLKALGEDGMPVFPRPQSWTLKDTIMNELVVWFNYTSLFQQGLAKLPFSFFLTTTLLSLLFSTSQCSLFNHVKVKNCSSEVETEGLLFRLEMVADIELGNQRHSSMVCGAHRHILWPQTKANFI